MNIAIVGGGGVGGYLAAKLSQSFEVDLISSSLQRLFLIEGGEKREYFPTIKKAPDRIYDVVLFATKSYDLEKKAKELLPFIQTDTIILPLLNGIEPYEKLRALFPQANVLKGAIYIIAQRSAPDTIEIKGKGALVVCEKNDTLATIFEKSGIKYKMPDSIDMAIWQKYLFIAATAALTSLYHTTFGEIANNHLDEFQKLLKEIVQIANKKGVSLGDEDIQRSITLLQKSPPNATTSLQRDLETGHKSELDNLIGYLAKESKVFANIYTKLRP